MKPARLLLLARMMVGLAMLRWPRRALRLLGVPRSEPPARAVVRVLGARHLLQGLLMVRAGRVGHVLGAAVDGGHALSGLVYARTCARRRVAGTRTALVSCGLATAELALARYAFCDEPGSEPDRSGPQAGTPRQVASEDLVDAPLPGAPRSRRQGSATSRFLRRLRILALATCAGGLWLLVAPFALHYPRHYPHLRALLVDLLAGMILLVLSGFQWGESDGARWASRGTLILGLLLVAAPFFLGYQADAALSRATTNDVVIGLAIVAAAALSRVRPRARRA
ncbi:MAG: hypothetical protein JWL64_1787 [Frankiales bacterium]|nr:hypothetical protein [Frankiales bacterium]